MSVDYMGDDDKVLNKNYDVRSQGWWRANIHTSAQHDNWSFVFGLLDFVPSFVGGWVVFFFKSSVAFFANLGGCFFPFGSWLLMIISVQRCILRLLSIVMPQALGHFNLSILFPKIYKNSFFLLFKKNIFLDSKLQYV